MATFVPNVTDIFPEPSLYRPDFSFLDTMLRRRQAMYNQGFAELSSKYSALARNITNPFNAKDRNQFMTEAQNQLKNLSAMDLSQQQNVQIAANVFTPLYNNKNVMADLSLTAHWDNQEKIAESFRTKDGGKEFSQDNIEYVRMQRNAFAQDIPEAAGEYLANKRYYSPYRDYSAKFQLAYEKFKPRVSKPVPKYLNGQWIIQEERTDVNAPEFQRYLESLLTPEEKRQIQIEGVVRYGNSPEQLLGVYGQKVALETKALDKHIDYFNTQLKLAKSADDKAEIAESLKYYTERKAQINENYSKLVTMDPKALNQVKEQIAGDLYYADKLESFGKAAERHDVKYDVQASEIWKTIYSNQQQWARQKDQQAFDMAKMIKENELKNASKTNPITGGAFTGNNVVLKASETNPYGIQGVENDILAARQAINAADQLIVSRLVTTNQSSDPATVKAFIDKYSKIQNDIQPVVKNNQVVGYTYRSTGKPVEPTVLSDLQAFQSWQSTVAPQQMKLNTLEVAKTQLNAEVKKQAGKEFDAIYSKVNNLLPGKNMVIQLGNNKSMNLSLKELYEGMESGSIKIETLGGTAYGAAGAGGATPTTQIITIGGNRINLDSPTHKLLKDMVNGIRKIYRTPEYKKLAETRKNVYSSNVINNNSLALFDPNSEFFKDKTGELEQIFGKPMQIRGADLLGGSLAVSAKDKADATEILERTRGRADVVYDETNDLFYIKGLKGMNVLSNFSPQQQAIYQSATVPVKGAKVGAGIYVLESAPFKIGNLPYDFQWKRIAREAPGVDGTTSLNYEYFLYDGNNKQVPLLSNMTDALQLISQIGQMGNNPGMTVQLVESLK